eukprot:COSAG01_NODE_3902_length_5561_cov_14.696448_5_plen_254_part_00
MCHKADAGGGTGNQACDQDRQWRIVREKSHSDSQVALSQFLISMRHEDSYPNHTRRYTHPPLHRLCSSGCAVWRQEAGSRTARTTAPPLLGHGHAMHRCCPLGMSSTSRAGTSRPPPPTTTSTTRPWPSPSPCACLRAPARPCGRRRMKRCSWAARHPRSAPRVSTPLFQDKNTQHVGTSQSKRPQKMWKHPLTSDHVGRSASRRRDIATAAGCGAGGGESSSWLWWWRLLGRGKRSEEEEPAALPPPLLPPP